MIRTRIECRQAGVLSTIQDGGRYEGLNIGIPQSGVMDYFAYEIANLLVGNAIESPVIETTFGNVEYLFMEAGIVAVTGAECVVKLNDCSVRTWESYRVKKGDRLILGACINGCRNYIAIGGVWQLGEKFYGSYATYLRGNMGGLNGSRLKIEDSIVTLWEGNCIKRALKSFNLPYFNQLKQSKKVIRIVMGPHESTFSDAGIETFLSTGYKVLDQSDRMGIRLSGRQIGHQLPADIISDGIAFGAIQVPSDGQPIIMMADRQTTGGYTKIGTVISRDLPIIAQAIKGDLIFFKAIAPEQLDEIEKEEGEVELKVGEQMLEVLHYVIDVKSDTQITNDSNFYSEKHKKNFHIRVEVLEDHHSID